MKRKSSVLLVILSAVICASLVSAVTQDDVEREKTLLVSFCSEFLRKRAENEWLYCDNDLSPYLMPGDHRGFASEELANYVKIINFYRTWRLEVGKKRESLSADRIVKEISVEGDSAHVKIREDLSYFITNGNGDPSSVTEDYEFDIVKKEGRYYITAIEVPYDGFWFLYKTEGFDEAEQLAYCRKTISGGGLPMTEVQTDVTGSAVPAGKTLDRLPYVAAYATAYSDIYAYDGSGGFENSHCYNPNFSNFDRYGGDCANYTSQCLYAGLGGNDLAAEIKDGVYPMDTEGAATWYNRGFSAYSKSWAGTLSVFKYACGVLSEKYEQGLVCRVFDAADPAQPYALPSGIDYVGAVMVVRGAGSRDYGHAIMITHAVGNDLTQMYFSAHSSSKTNICIAEYISGGGILHPLRVIVPLWYRSYSDCPGHVYGDAAQGFDSVCDLCGFCRMRPAQNWAVVKKGGTLRLSGGELSGLSPYSVTITLSDSAGNTLFQTSDPASAAYTFSEAGLYHVSVSMTDRPGGKTVTSVSTVRVPEK